MEPSLRSIKMIQTLKEAAMKESRSRFTFEMPNFTRSGHNYVSYTRFVLKLFV